MTARTPWYHIAVDGYAGAGGSWNMECGRIGLQMVVLRSRLFSDTLLEDDELLQK